MKEVEELKKPLTLKIFALLLVATGCFFLGKRWVTGYDQVLVVSASSRDSDTDSNYVSRSPSVVLVPNATRNYDLSSLNITTNPPYPTPPLRSPSPPPPPLLSPPPPPPLPPPPPPPPISTTLGVLGPDGAMQTDFKIGTDDDGDDDGDGIDLDSDPMRNTSEPLENGSPSNDTSVPKFNRCPANMSEYIPCLDNVDAIRKLNSTEKGERFERRCPDPALRLRCLIPSPKHYRAPIPWPKSRDEVWYSNVPHTRLVEDKGGQNWIELRGDKFTFPGGGTQFIHGADSYIDQMAQMVPDLAFGVHTRVALDVGCGVASFGAALLSRNVLTLSIAPKDVHENQIQFALERGVPAMVAAFATHRLLYPSQAFDMIHCSRCRINWTRDGGILLLEVNRLLRAGGYFTWAAQPVYKHEAIQQEAWKEMEDLATRICWKLVKKEGYIAIWQKPVNNTCYVSRDAEIQPPLCNVEDEPDNIWYVPLKACITRLPENGFGGNLTNWPDRLHTIPDRLETVQLDGFMAKKEIYTAETNYWKMVVGGYLRGLGWKRQHFRNVMDMRAGFGGFAAAVLDEHLDVWVMNVVPVSGPNTLPVIYDRGLIGVAHDWCEAFDTYPRTYDLLHASGLFSVEEKRCNIADIILEMDRIMRPGGSAFLRDTRPVLAKVEVIAKAMGWSTRMIDTEEGTYASIKVLSCQKKLVHS